MVRRTVTLPDSLDRRVREAAHDDESFSAAVARIVEQGLQGKDVPGYIGVGEGPGDTVASRKRELIAEIVGDAFEREREYLEGRGRDQDRR